MGYGPSQVNLAFEPAKRVLVTHAHGLHGYPGAEIQILGLIDLTHAARPDRPHDTVSSREHLAGVQSTGDGRGPHPLAADQTDVQQSASVCRVAQHGECLLAQFRIPVCKFSDIHPAVRGRLFHRRIEQPPNLRPALGGHSNLRISLT